MGWNKPAHSEALEASEEGKTMLITFKSKLDNTTPWDVVQDITALVSADIYNGNVYAAQTWARGSRVRFTLKTRDSDAFGSRRSWSGRRMKKASWEAFRDVLRAILKAHPDAVIRTSMATYRGLEGFESTYRSTAYKNIGSMMSPTTMPDQTVY